MAPTLQQHYLLFWSKILHSLWGSLAPFLLLFNSTSSCNSKTALNLFINKVNFNLSYHLFHFLYVILIFSSFLVYWSLANYYISDLSDIYMVKSVYSSIEARVQWSGSSLVTSFKLNSIFPCFMYSVYHSNVNHTRVGTI